jgi:pimeloyl-ACP methyl ester carboxylesterase
MKIYNKLLIIFLFIFSIVNADTTFINEPILNSKVYVETHGSKNKEVVVFVHGLGDEASTIWKNSVDKLKNDYFVITFDLPGLGNSSKQSAEYTPTKYAQVIDYIVSKYTDKPFYLVGHSMGGAISLKYTQLYESKVKKLFLIDVAGILYKDAYSQFLIKTEIDKFFKIEETNVINKKVSDFFSNGLNKLMPTNLYDVVRTDYLRNNMFHSNTKAIAAVGLITETFFYLERLNVPTIILWGEKDEVAPLRTAYVLNKLIKNSTLKIIKNSGHVPIIDSSDIYLDYLDKFLKNEIEVKSVKFNEISLNNLEISNQNNLILNCNSKSIRIINSRNIQLKNCNLEDLYVENSSVWVLNSKIESQDTALKVANSKLYVTATDIKGKIAVDTFNSELDFAAVNIYSFEISILSETTNKIIFSLTTLRGPITNKILHKKITMTNNNKL